MGSVIVNIMEGSTLAAEHKKLHPFFTAPKSLQPESQSLPTTPGTASTCSTAPLETTNTQDKMDELEEPDVTPAKRKRRKAAEEGKEDGEEAKKPKRGRPRKVAQQGPSIMEHFSKANGEAKEPDPSESTAVLEEGEEKRAAAPIPQLQPDASIAQDEVTLHENEKSGQNKNGDSKQVLPKKMLQFNPKTGTIGSPPKPKEPKPSKKQAKTEDTTEDTITPTRRGKRRSRRIATINYGFDDASRMRIGAKIDDILSYPVTASPKRKTRPRTSPRGQIKVESTEETLKKDTHPFFTGKAKKHAADSTPAPAISNAPFPQFGMRSLGLKTPGACYPAWPSKDMVHVRGVDDDAFTPSQPSAEHKLAARKSKGNTTQISAEENLLNNFVTGLDLPEVLDAIRNADTENFLPPPKELRLPEKYFESGVKLEQRILREIKNANHPALAQLRNYLVTCLSAFDRYTCESVCWAQKYTPKSAVEVLQYGKEAFLLRDWLEAMKVLSVDTGEVKAKPAKPPKKKRKKNKDDFIVDSDEEAGIMDEISDPEEDWSPNRRGVKKTVIRTGDNAAKDSKNPGRLTNTVVLSGPHGCGKTSTVYAIARELDFEVFEINSGSRRSGKDILERIGDMTRNHLVQHGQPEASAAAIDEEEVAEDIKSGKQATMNSFFKPKAATQPAKAKPAKETPAPVKTESRKASPRNQKQSLILLDEIDILYEEDKQFWNTVITLIAQSKRPFIMTCNDENLVPLQALSLHGIFRFNAPPADLAIDRLLMIAACEGHALRRNSIAALYEARQQDLRACLMDLNCWCQVAVGASRGGIDWLLPRWPKDCDIDQDGNVVRVISQDTYVEGMGWLGHDLVSQEAEHENTEQELLHEVNDFWQMDLAHWHDSLDLPSWAGALDDAQDRLSLLQSYEDFTDAMSFADLSAMSFATSVQERIDCTLPEMTPKAREDYIFGRQLLDAPVWSTYDPLAVSLPIALKCLARKNLQASLPGKPSQLNALDESSVISKIRHHASASLHTTALTRDDFSMAFDVLAISEKEANSTSTYLDPSVFDGTFQNITVDVAPYVRSVVAFEKELQRQRQKLSGLLSQGGVKRARKTRAAHAALEGGSRSTVRREKWFDADLNGVLVMHTAGKGWADVVEEEDISVSSSASAVDPAARRARARRIVMDGCNEDDDSGSSGVDGT
ncbi:hypothetical protein N0V93_005868 [Gnomoniopsis smithogilvyi]|uniref:AAA+ ATPase domain-containing protein n=1 Tax=Gnomoniopsis smithogilvyi TaxID=1191159 RepID=A0A9W8YVI6_9PEZI|nr:hypothetical protein N0V93_005868 [Gnomoniopsis smithogilvyi]